MGYCNYYTNPNGNAVATWVGSGTDAGKSKRVVFLKGSLGAKNKTAACNDARSQFCKQYGIGGRCYSPQIQSQVSCAQNLIEQGLSGKPLCGDLTYPPDPLKGTSKTGGSSGSSNTSGSSPSGADTRNCAQGNFMACFSEIGNSFGNFFTDASRTGGQQLPLMLLLGAGIILVVLLKR